MGTIETRTIDAKAARALLAAGGVLIDVREPDECAMAPIAGALMLPLSKIEEASHRLPDRARPLIVICALGQRSRTAAERLVELGFTNVASVIGGRIAWERTGEEAVVERDFDSWEQERYARHFVLPEVGLEGQRRLRAARVLLVGAGGLGSPVGLYLAAAGVGHLRIVDPDRVEASNLQRQVLHSEATIGKPKVESAAATIAALNSRVNVEPLVATLDARSVGQMLEGVTVAVDGSDNFAAREILNAACVKAGIPLVSAAIERFRGQLSVWWPAAPDRSDAPCYACVFPAPPHGMTPPTCADAGVLGVLPGILGCLQASEVIKLIIGTGEPLIGRLLMIDALGARFREVRVMRDPSCHICRQAAPTTICG